MTAAAQLEQPRSWTPVDDLAHRAELAASWQLTESLPDLVHLVASVSPRIREPPPGADIWDLTTWLARSEQRLKDERSQMAFVWARALLWHSAYVYMRLAVDVPTARGAGEIYRSREIQDELRAGAMRIAMSVMSK